VGGLILTSITGILLIGGSAYAFYRWSWNALYGCIPFALAIIVVHGFVAAINGELVASSLSAIVLGGAAGVTLRFKKPLHFFILAASLGATAIFATNYYYLKAVKNVDLFAESQQRFIAYVQNSPAGVDQKKKEEMLRQIEESMTVIRDLVPFSYFLNSLIFSAFAFLVLRMLARKFTNGAITGGKGLEYFRMDDRLIYVLIAGWAAFLMVDKTRFHTLNMAALNTALIFSFLYIVQAMGIIKFFAMKKNIPVWVIPLGALMLISLFAQLLLFFAVMLASLGAIDFWADFRKLETPGGAAGSDE